MPGVAQSAFLAPKLRWGEDKEADITKIPLSQNHQAQLSLTSLKSDVWAINHV
jgi:hypothetical protein